MNKLLNKWKNRLILRRSGCRLAAPKDIDFVMEQIVEGAKGGHYDESMLDTEHQSNFKGMLNNLLQGIGTPTMTERGVERKSGSLWIYGNKYQGNIGFFFISEKHEGSGEKEIELLMAGIKDQFRGIGHGSNMVDLFLALCPETAILYARCFSKSKAMYAALIGAGFVEINIKPGGTRELEFKRA
jgi:ribosomal protein S18 acetylase RimI-like enzyme